MGITGQRRHIAVIYAQLVIYQLPFVAPPFTTMPPTLADYLDAPDAAGNVLAHARLLLRLTEIYRDIVPGYLGENSKVVNFKAGTIVVHAGNGATAIKLKQLATTLQAGFARRGVDCQGIQVRVEMPQAVQHPPRAPARIKPLTGATQRSLADLRDALPGSPLRTALDELLSRSARSE